MCASRQPSFKFANIILYGCRDKLTNSCTRKSYSMAFFKESIIMNQHAQHMNFSQPRFNLPLPNNGEFPYYALPEKLKEVLNEGYAITKAPPELILISMFAAMSLAVQSIAKVSVNEHKSGSCGIFALVIAEPSEGKSSCDRLFFQPIEEWEKNEKLTAEAKFSRYLSELNTWEITCQQIKAAVREEVKNNATL